MNKSVIVNLFFLVIVFTGNAHSCPVKLLPNSDFQAYEQIFIGEVTKVDLVQYAIERSASMSQGKNQKYFADITLSHDVSVIVTKSFKGNVSGIKELKISGCGVVIPKTKAYGLFFINGETGTTIPVYQSEGEIFQGIFLSVYEYFKSHK